MKADRIVERRPLNYPTAVRKHKERKAVRRCVRGRRERCGLCPAVMSYMIWAGDR